MFRERSTESQWNGSCQNCKRPPLWNIFFEDAKTPINQTKFKEIAFADDLNAYKALKGTVRNKTAFKMGTDCQNALHRWGHANSVCFDAGKEGMNIISRLYIDILCLLVSCPRHATNLNNMTMYDLYILCNAPGMTIRK